MGLSKSFVRSIHQKIDIHEIIEFMVLLLTGQATFLQKEIAQYFFQKVIDVYIQFLCAKSILVFPCNKTVKFDDKNLFPKYQKICQRFI